jgi:hypothetical protein
VFQHQTPLGALRDFAPPAFGPEPAGFVFHLSRCGSTLVSQMLGRCRPAWCCRAGGARHHAPRAAWRGDGGSDLLRGLVGALGRPRAAGERRLFVKLDSWQIHALPLLRRAFPDVPWIFLLRDPLEVLVSHRRQRGAQMIPGVLTPAAAGLDLATAAGMEATAYAAHVLARACAAARDGLSLGGGLLVHYEELPGAVEERSRLISVCRSTTRSARRCASRRGATPSIQRGPSPRTRL